MYRTRTLAPQQPGHGGQQPGQAQPQRPTTLRPGQGQQQHQDPAVVGDRDRLRETERLRDRLHDMERQMEQAHDALRKAIGQP